MTAATTPLPRRPASRLNDVDLEAVGGLVQAIQEDPDKGPDHGEDRPPALLAGFPTMSLAVDPGELHCDRLVQRGQSLPVHLR